MQEFLPLVHRRLVQDLLELEPQPDHTTLEIFFSFRMRLNNS
jgi:hypothetical protein